MQTKNDNEIFDEKIFSLLKKIEVPKNPFSFYLNISKIEKNLSEWLRDYFYKAINEFLHHSNSTKYDENGKNNSDNFLMKIYYYTGFIDKLAIAIDNFLKEIKYYDLNFYLDCAQDFDPTLKLKIAYFLQYWENLENLEKYFLKIQENTLENDVKIQNLLNNSDVELFEDFEEKFLKLDETKHAKTIDFIYQNTKVNLLKYKISYKTTNQDYNNFIQEKTQNARYYKWISICMDKIVSKYDKEQAECKWFFGNFLKEKNTIDKNCFISNLINWQKNSFAKLQKIAQEKTTNNFFEYEHEFKRFLISYLINEKHADLKRLFYWEATKDRLSEDEWADIGWANLFYLQKIDKNIWNFQLLIFFKQFKDTLTQLYNSIFWPLIKPYFFYILIFKSVKLPLKDRYKMFFLLMFFSSESYQEYFILQKIMKSIEKIWLWKSYVWIEKIIFYFKRFTSLIGEFLSSGILFSILIFTFWWFWLMNFFMLAIVALILFISCIKYLIFPWRMEVLRVFVFLSIWLLWYVWFTRILPKITQGEYISYLWKTVDNLVSLDFSKTAENRKNMINFVYGENYENLENKFIAKIKEKGVSLAKNENFQKIIESTQKYTTDILKKEKIIKLEKWKYLKYYINQEIDKLNLTLKQKKALGDVVAKEYINRYCFLHNNEICRQKLEKLPVGFNINLNKIQKILKENISK